MDWLDLEGLRKASLRWEGLGGLLLCVIATLELGRGSGRSEPEVRGAFTSFHERSSIRCQPEHLSQHRPQIQHPCQHSGILISSCPSCPLISEIPRPSVQILLVS